jgi:hypothetical protein
MQLSSPDHTANAGIEEQMNKQQIAELAEQVRARRQGLNVKLASGNVLSFATEASRDEFIARARRLGEEPTVC